jgi:hypothetical protein
LCPKPFEAGKHFSRLTLDASEQHRLAGDVYSNLTFVPGCVVDEARKLADVVPIGNEIDLAQIEVWLKNEERAQ